MRHRFKFTWLLTFLFSVYPILAIAAPVCADLFDVMPLEVSQNEKLQAVVADVPVQNKELVAHHPISIFAKSLVKPLRVNFYNIGRAKTNETIDKGQVGESLQTRYVRRIVDSIFKVSSVNSQDIDLNIRDITEYGDPVVSRSDKTTLPMHMIKPVTKWNTGFNSRAEARKALKIPVERKIVHFYIRGGFNSKGEALESQGLQRFIQELREAELFDVVIVSLNMGSKAHHIAEVNKYPMSDVHYLNDNLGDLLENRTLGGVPHGSIIFNETLGMMPTIHQISNLAIIGGAINFYEPAQVGTPTIAYRLREGQAGGGEGVDPSQMAVYTADTQALSQQLSWFQHRIFDNNRPYELGKIYQQLSDPQGNPRAYYQTGFYKNKFNEFLSLIMEKVSSQLHD